MNQNLPVIVKSAYVFVGATENTVVNRKTDYLNELLPVGYKQRASEMMLEELIGKETITSKNCSFFYYEAIRLIHNENWEEIRFVNAVLYIAECYLYHVNHILPQHFTIETVEQAKLKIEEMCKAFPGDENLIYNFIYGFLTAGENLY